MTQVIGGFRGPEWGQFRFSTRELEHWFDGQKRILVRGQDFPDDAPLDQVKRRLERAANKRHGSARVWFIDGDQLGVVLTPSWS